MNDYFGDLEAHLTVQPADAAALARFQDWCHQRTLRCVRIVLARGTHPDQPMATWRRRAATLPRMLAEARRHVAELEQAGLPVVRVKIEAAPDNADVPQGDADAAAQPVDHYFEHHVKLARPANAPTAALVQVCGPYGAHLSRNAFRIAADGTEERFVTLRSYGIGRAASDQLLRLLLSDLARLGEVVLERESEYCVHDSQVGLDAGWLPSPA